MKFLIDKSKGDVERKLRIHPNFVEGQLLTPLTSYANWGGTFAIDNGAFSGFPHKAFLNLLERERERKEQCLFVTCPDVVANCRRTLEIWKYRKDFIPEGWPLAFVAQDGAENHSIPWDELDAVFIGGGNPWKDLKEAADIVRTAKILKKHVHIGRVNNSTRFNAFAKLGADTCDGSGVSRYDHMLDNIARAYGPVKPSIQTEFLIQQNL